MDVRTELTVTPGEEDQYLTKGERLGLAKSAISQLLLQIKEKMGVSPYDLHQMLDTLSVWMVRIERNDADWEGNDLAKERREAARKALTGSKVEP